MDVIALRCATKDFGELFDRYGVPHLDLDAQPGRTEVDPVLAERGGRRLLVCGTDADLAAVVLRVLRKELLGEVEVAYLPTVSTTAARLWAIPANPHDALRLAVSGSCVPAPLIRDDAGGVLLGQGQLEPVRGAVYCDDTRIVDSSAVRVRVWPDPDGGAGLCAEATRRGFLGSRVRTEHGRAVQIGCAPATLTRDGVRHPRQIGRWGWYRHIEDLRLVRPDG